MSEKSNVHTVLVQELNGSCDMVKLSIENMDDNIWSEKKNEWSYVNNLYHIINTIEFYCQDGPNDLKEKGSLGINEHGLSKEEVKKKIEEEPKEFYLDYLEKARKQLIEKINRYSMDELFRPDDFSEWGFTSRFHKYSYTLRHTVFHTGELNKTLRDLQKTRIKWS